MSSFPEDVALNVKDWNSLKELGWEDGVHWMRPCRAYVTGNCPLLDRIVRLQELHQGCGTCWVMVVQVVHLLIL